MKKIIFATTLLIVSFGIKAQDKFYTKTGKIGFDATSAGSPEKIEGINKSSVCVLDIKTGNIQFAVMMKGFLFERALMEEHFNENYVESSKFPKTEFKGIVSNNSAVNYTKDGNYNVKVKGNLTMHGVTKEIETSGTITIKSGKIIAAASFTVVLKDFKVLIPTLVSDKVSPNATITVDCSMEPLKI